ncbi:ATP-binding protein [Noviherbaspirillum galbum]|uniref:histidine kinase n=1 Tax=Noviherbaspirillum galbum TaxID=2709383 RepID=A0A6B3SZB3_9BURK|nr:ATP-binding protein [Noviherbaspirillum galbum]NEX64532.1 PAS domain S-box protein [Noviherbaspirillum galbum]
MLPSQARTAVITASLLWLTIILAIGFALIRERRQDLYQAQDEVATLATVFDENMSRTFGTVDVALQGIAAHLADGDFARHDPQVRELMRGYLRYLPAVRALFVIGPNGIIQHDTDYPKTPDVSLADREYFSQYIRNPKLVQGLSSAMQSRSGTGWFLASSRRITSSGGEFKGVLVAAVQLDSLSRLYEKLNLRPGEVMSLYHKDGRLIARHPADDVNIGRSFAFLPLFSTRIPMKPTGVHRISGPPLNYPSVMSYRVLEAQPLVVVFSRSEDLILATWKRAVNWALVIAVAFLLLTAAGVLFYIQKQQQRQRAIALQLAEAEALALAEANAKFRAFFEQGFYLSCVLSQDGIVLESNSAGIDLCGYSHDQIIGQAFWDCAWWSRSPDTAATLQNGFAKARDGASFSAEVAYFLADGTQKLIELVLSPILDVDGAVFAIAAVGVDITDQKQKEEALRAFATQLSEVDKKRSEFLATLSHELRNVLMPLQTGFELLAQTASSGQPNARVHAIVQRQLLQMKRLIEDLLDVSRVSSGKVRMERERVDLRDVLENVVESAQAFMEPAGHELKLSLSSEPLDVEIDTGRMFQVFTNLLGNAAKYTPPGGHIHVRAYKEEGEAVVEVLDDGIGIPASALATVFEMFEQVSDHAANAQGGLGIGLSLVQKLVGLHGGTVEAFSEGENRGSTFTVRLPLA